MKSEIQQLLCDAATLLTAASAIAKDAKDDKIVQDLKKVENSIVEIEHYISDTHGIEYVGPSIDPSNYRP